MKLTHIVSLNVLIFGLDPSSTLVNARPHRQLKRQISELRDSYDFVIAGGGTTGLTIADRLTQAFPKSRYSSSPAPILCDPR